MSQWHRQVLSMTPPPPLPYHTHLHHLSQTHSTHICDQSKMVCGLITVIGTIQQLSCPPSCDYGNDTEGGARELGGTLWGLWRDIRSHLKGKGGILWSLKVGNMTLQRGRGWQQRRCGYKLLTAPIIHSYTQTVVDLIQWYERKKARPYRFYGLVQGGLFQLQLALVILVKVIPTLRSQRHKRWIRYKINKRMFQSSCFLSRKLNSSRIKCTWGPGVIS